jgi:hypothetical protein
MTLVATWHMVWLIFLTAISIARAGTALQSRRYLAHLAHLSPSLSVDGDGQEHANARKGIEKLNRQKKAHRQLNFLAMRSAFRRALC